MPQKLKAGQTAFKCPRCNADLIFGKKRSPNYTCHACGQQMFITEERLKNPELLKRSIEMFHEERKPYKVVIKNRQFNNGTRRQNNFINQ